MTKRVEHTLSTDSLGDGVNYVAQQSCTQGGKQVYIVYFRSEYTSPERSEDNSIIRLKPRKTPLTKEQWDARVKQLQNVR